MLNILSDLFVNLVIIIASLTLGNLIVREKITKFDFRSTLIISLLSGILGCLLMVYSVRVSPNVIVDFRCIPIMILGIYSSISAATIAALFIGLFRILYLGLDYTSTAALMIALLMAVTCGLIGKSKFRIQVKWLFSSLAVCLITGLGFIFLINNITILTDVLPAFYIGLLIVSVVTYHLMAYILKSNENYNAISEASKIDFLTGLHNVRHFDSSLNTYLDEAKNKNYAISLLFIDIDYFKKVNDIYGHLNGDKVLKEFGEILLRLSRENDIVTRKGGEEFTVLLVQCDLDEAKQVAERICQYVEKHKYITENNEIIKITISIGVSCFPETTTDEEKLIEQADISLYNAKRAGRNKVVSADQLQIS